MDTVEPGIPLGMAVGLASAAVLTFSVAVLIYRQRGSKTVSRSQPSQAPTRKPVESRASIDEPGKPRVRVVYGTQTGTAERFSKQLGGELRKKYGEGVTVDVVDMENYRPADQLPREKLVVMCLATYGDGEPTDNAAEFFNWLQKELDSNSDNAPLKDVTYAVFGLGNKQYEHFNAIGKKAYAGLQTLGATPLLRRGDGDDDACIDDDFEKWCGELHEALDARPDLVGHASEQNGHANGHALAFEAPAAYEVQLLPAGTSEVPPFPANGTGKDHHSPFWATITCARELHTPKSDRSCVHVELDLSGAGVGYEHGDHVAIHAQNSPQVVEEMAALLGVDLDTVFSLTLPQDAAGLSTPFPGPLRLRTALSYFADVLSSPHKDALLALAACAADKEQAARLQRLASQEGKAEYAEWIGRQHRSLLEVMRAFPSARPSLGVFFGSIAPRLQPRFYSISSSPKLHPASVHVTCAVVRETMPTGRLHEGVASTWLHSHVGAGVGAKVPVFIRHSHFKLPSDPSKPVVMVGPGTGLAPFRGFIQERAALLARNPSAALGPAVLFFGCRTREQDYIYEEELEGAVQGGALTTLHVAFSRQGAQKDYVQHHMEREGKKLWELLGEQGGSLYVCGDAKHMAKDVHKTLVALVAAGKGCSGTQAEGVVKAMQDEGRYQRDVW